MWMVRAGDEAAYVDEFVDQAIVAIGFGDRFGAVPRADNRKDLVAAYRRLYPEHKEHRALNAASQLYRFLHEFNVGDGVATSDSGRRRYLVGTIEGDPVWEATGPDELRIRRKVRWKGRIARDLLSTSTRNSLGSILTIFRLNAEVATELNAKAVPIETKETAVPVSAPVREREALSDLRGSVIDKSKEFTQDLIASLDDQEMEHLVAGVLRAMGYKTRVSPRGGDRGHDIFASPDGLGLQEPRIFAEVKHRPSTAMGAPEIRSFIGGRKPADRCLYVSTGGFTKEARYEAERSSVPLTLVDLPELRKFVVLYYEELDEETRQLVPLTKIYWPLDSEA